MCSPKPPKQDDETEEDAADLFDAAIARDAALGKLDAWAQEAIAEYRAGKRGSFSG